MTEHISGEQAGEQGGPRGCSWSYVNSQVLRWRTDRKRRRFLKNRKKHRIQLYQIGRQTEPSNPLLTCAHESAKASGCSGVAYATPHTHEFPIPATNE